MAANDHSIVIGKKIRRAMNDLNITVKELSAQTGIQPQTIYSILNGHHQASPEKMQSICRVLHLSMDSLFDLDTNVFPIYPKPYEESYSYAVFEDIWFGPTGGERISVSRGFSTANQSLEMREQMLRKVFHYNDEQVSRYLKGFEQRLDVIRTKEKNRLEIVVESEVIDFIHQNDFYSLIPRKCIVETIERIIDTLENRPHKLEVFIIPRQYFLVNYEIINREVILFDLGSVFLRQTHHSIMEHFLKEVETFKSKYAVHREREDVIQFLKGHLQNATKN
ncbi:MAG: helix-turn-helix transcriptional regulator [Calditrichaeota bacterium]|nr:helix-turn-helix transcriptional regulator [Calditrichota bacterium]